MLTKTQEIYYRVRVALIAATMIISIFGCIKASAFSWDLDFHLHPPGGEADQLEQKSRDKENRKANKRVKKNEKEGKKSNPKDVKKALEHEKDHGG